jgi:hypothetical protein
VVPFQNLDTLYDVAAGAFLLGSVTFDVIGHPIGSSILSINQEGTELFVNGGQQIFPDFGTASVFARQILPEPSTLLLCIIALGVVGGWRKRGG